MYQEPRSVFLQETYPDTVLQARIRSFQTASLVGDPGGLAVITSEPNKPEPIGTASDFVSEEKKFK